jgi:Putative zinc-finger
MIEMHRETEQLGAYVLGALDERETAELAAHIEGCPICRRELTELESVRDLLGDLPPEAMLDGPPEDGELLLQRTLWQVRREARSYSRRRPLLAAAAAVLAAALLGVGILVGQRISAPVVQPTVAPTPSASTPTPVPGTRTATATDATTGATLDVTVIPAAGWVRVAVRAGGIPAGADCRLVVVADDGRRESAGTWRVSAAGERDGTPLAGFALVDPAEVEAVEVEDLNGRLFVRAPIT